jgi:hypothetical protein
MPSLSDAVLVRRRQRVPRGGVEHDAHGEDEAGADDAAAAEDR